MALLIIAADYVYKPLHHIITLSIMQHRFPTGWKYAKVIPLFKNGSPTDRKNYRPVSLLSPLGKILEKVIYSQIYTYFEKNRLFHENLHGYRKNRSTLTALLQMHDKWVKATNQGQISGAVLLDLSAAFDLVDHGILHEKLKVYGFDNEFRELISSYLYQRQSAVWISDCFSEYTEYDVGVPQGSNLGPLFFSIFFNDLPFTLDCDLEVYADDSTLFHSSKDPVVIEERLTRNCDHVSVWMRRNRLKLNTDKIHFLTIGTSNRIGALTSQINVKIDGQNIVENDDKCEKTVGHKYAIKS